MHVREKRDLMPAKQLRALLPYMTKLQYLKLDNCRCEGEAISTEGCLLL